MDQIFSVKENSTPGLICATISASDPDGDILTYKLDEENVSFPFEIDPNNGNLKIKSTANLDYEEMQQYKFRVKVKDATQSSSAFVTIQIIDQSEIPNVIDQSFDINENIEGVYSIGVIKFKSKGQNEEFNFSIVEGNTSNLFFIGEKSGELFLANDAKLNYESAESHSIQIKVQNKSNTELYTIVTVGVNVADVNEKPAINNQSFSILENSVDNTEIGLVIASDVDAGQSLNYSIIQATISNAVKVDSSTGKLFVSDKSKFDFETNKQIILAIKVTDNGTEALSDTANIIVNILDTNENPVITTKKLQVDENSMKGDEVGKVIANSYEGAPIEYTIAAGDGTGKFTMNKNTGIISVAQSGVLNYETKNSYSLTIKVNEVAKPEFTTSAVIAIDLNDINEHPVLTDQQFTAYESQAVGAVLGRVSANDPDFGQSLIYSIVAGNPEGYFSIDPSNGNILLAKPVMMNGADELTFTLTAQVKDNGIPQLFSEANVTISVVKRAIPYSETIQPSATDGIDAFIYDLKPDKNYGTHPDFMASAWTNDGTPVIVRSIIKFDFSKIPTDAIIDSVRLSLYSYYSPLNKSHSTLDGSNSCVLQKITSSWDENLVTWHNQPSTTSYDQVILVQSHNEIEDYLNIDVTNLTKGMIKNTSPNYGFMIKLETEELYRSLVFASSDNMDPNLHPKLVIYYTLEH